MVEPQEASALGIVILLRCPKPLAASAIAALFARVTGEPHEIVPSVNNGLPDLPDGNAVLGEPPSLVVQTGGDLFLVTSVPEPYIDDVAAAASDTEDAGVAQALLHHRAWLSVEILHPEAVSAANYRIVGRAVAEFLDEDALALFHPESEQIVAVDLAGTRAQLLTRHPIASVFDLPADANFACVEGSAALRAAEAEAQNRLPEFEAAFRQFKQGLGRYQDFSVKAHLTSETGGEHIWIEVHAWNGARISGCLANDPHYLLGLQAGSLVTMHQNQIEDWAYCHGEQPVGMFTVPVRLGLKQHRSLKPSKTSQHLVHLVHLVMIRASPDSMS